MFEDDWPDNVLGDGFDEDFYQRIAGTGFMDHPHKFNVYLRKRLPDKSLQKVRMWKNVLPEIDEVGIAFGAGEAVIDFEILFGRSSGKKKKGIRTVVRFGENYDERKRIHENRGY